MGKNLLKLDCDLFQDALESFTAVELWKKNAAEVDCSIVF